MGPEIESLRGIGWQFFNPSFGLWPVEIKKARSGIKQCKAKKKGAKSTRGKFWRALEWKMLVYFMVIWYIFGHFVKLW
jgi:hypothetical protein